MPMPLAPCTSSNGRSPTNTQAAGSSSPTAAIAARNASGCGLVQGSSLEYTVPSIRSSTWSRTKHPSCMDRGHRVLESTPILMPLRRSSRNSGGTSGPVNVCGSQAWK